MKNKYKITTLGPQGNAYAIMGYVTTAMEQERQKIWLEKQNRVLTSGF